MFLCNTNTHRLEKESFEVVLITKLFKHFSFNGRESNDIEYHTNIKIALEVLPN